MRISDWSSDVCSSDLGGVENISETSSQIIDGCLFFGGTLAYNHAGTNQPGPTIYTNNQHFNQTVAGARFYHAWQVIADNLLFEGIKGKSDTRSEEHTSELQSLMRISYAVFCLNKKINKKKNTILKP